MTDSGERLFPALVAAGAEPTCGNCRLGRPSPNGPDVISCRARPPAVFVHDVFVSHGHALTGDGPIKATQILSEFPTIPATEWCAEHRYRGES